VSAPHAAAPPVARYPVSYGGYEDRNPRHDWAGPVGPSQQGMAIAGFVLSLTFVPLGFIFSLIALNGMKRTGNNEGKGLAIAGLVISSVFIAMGCLWIIGLATCFGGFNGF
jgi:hypothetical protein